MRTYPSSKATGHAYIVAEESAGAEHMLSKKLDVEKLMLLHGPGARDYNDLTHIAKGMAMSKMHQSLSKFRAPFQEMLEGSGAEEVVDKNYVQWKVYGEPETRAMSFGDPNDESIVDLGLNHSIFQVWTDFDFYSAGDVLAPVYNKTAEVVVQNDYPTHYDGGFLWDVVIKDNSPTKTYDRDLLVPGMYFIKQGSVSSHAAIGQFGSIQMAESFAYIEYRVPMSTMSWKFEVTGEAHRQWGSIGVTRIDEETGRPTIGTGGITNYIEAKFKAQINYESDLATIYGRMSDHMIDGVTGEQITTSPGLFQWLEYGQEYTFSPEENNLDFFGEIFQSLWFDRLSTSEWNVTLLTGMGGLQKFSKWVEERFGSQAVIRKYDFVLKSTTPFDDSGSGRKAHGYVPPQFTEYALPGFGTIRVAHWAVLDDTKINGAPYPGSMFPVSSFEYIALDTGFGKPNVKKLVRDNARYSSYVPGYWSPLGAVNPENPIWNTPNPEVGDAYHLLDRRSWGLIIPNPELIVRFRPNVV